MTSVAHRRLPAAAALKFVQLLLAVAVVGAALGAVPGARAATVSYTGTLVLGASDNAGAVPPATDLVIYDVEFVDIRDLTLRSITFSNSSSLPNASLTNVTVTNGIFVGSLTGGWLNITNVTSTHYLYINTLSGGARVLVGGGTVIAPTGTNLCAIDVANATDGASLTVDGAYLSMQQSSLSSLSVVRVRSLTAGASLTVANAALLSWTSYSSSQSVCGGVEVVAGDATTRVAVRNAFINLVCYYSPRAVSVANASALEVVDSTMYLKGISYSSSTGTHYAVYSPAPIRNVTLVNNTDVHDYYSYMSYFASVPAVPDGGSMTVRGNRMAMSSTSSYLSRYGCKLVDFTLGWNVGSDAVLRVSNNTMVGPQDDSGSRLVDNLMTGWRATVEVDDNFVGSNVVTTYASSTAMVMVYISFLGTGSTVSVRRNTVEWYSQQWAIFVSNSSGFGAGSSVHVCDNSFNVPSWQRYNSQGVVTMRGPVLNGGYVNISGNRIWNNPAFGMSTSQALIIPSVVHSGGLVDVVGNWINIEGSGTYTVAGVQSDSTTSLSTAVSVTSGTVRILNNHVRIVVTSGYLYGVDLGLTAVSAAVTVASNNATVREGTTTMALVLPRITSSTSLRSTDPLNITGNYLETARLAPGAVNYVSPCAAAHVALAQAAYYQHPRPIYVDGNTLRTVRCPLTIGMQTQLSTVATFGVNANGGVFIRRNTFYDEITGPTYLTSNAFTASPFAVAASTTVTISDNVATTQYSNGTQLVYTVAFALRATVSLLTASSHRPASSLRQTAFCAPASSSRATRSLRPRTARTASTHSASAVTCAAAPTSRSTPTSSP